MAYRFIAFRREGIVAHLTFQRPERRNALNHDMMREIGEAVERVGADRNLRALVLRGRGGAFCAGGDLGAMTDMPPAPAAGPDPLIAPYRYFGEVLARLNRLPQAVIAVVEGPAVGGGLGMSAAPTSRSCTGRPNSAFPSRARASFPRRCCPSSCAGWAKARRATSPLPEG